MLPLIDMTVALFLILGTIGQTLDHVNYIKSHRHSILLVHEACDNYKNHWFPRNGCSLLGMAMVIAVTFVFHLWATAIAYLASWIIANAMIIYSNRKQKKAWDTL